MTIKNHFKKIGDLYLIYTLTISLGIIFYYVEHKPEITISFLVTGISISFGYRQYKIQNDQMFKELFIMFNAKYDDKFNECLNSIEKHTIDNCDYKLTNEEEALIIDYLNLCAEEYLWFLKGRIDDLVWVSWESGMKYYFNIKSIKKIVDIQKEQKDSYYGLFDRI